MVGEQVFATHEIIALLGELGNYKIWIRELATNIVTEYSVSNGFVETCFKRSPEGVFREFKNDNVIVEGSLNETQLLIMLGRTYDKHITGDGRMNLGETH